jgi:hypothetical protein
MKMSYEVLTAMVMKMSYEVLTALVMKMSYEVLTALVMKMSYEVLTALVMKMSYEVLTALAMSVDLYIPLRGEGEGPVPCNMARIHCVTQTTPAVNQTEREADHSPPSTAEELYLRCLTKHRDNFTLCIFLQHSCPCGCGGAGASSPPTGLRSCRWSRI